MVIYSFRSKFRFLIPASVKRKNENKHGPDRNMYKIERPALFYAQPLICEVDCFAPSQLGCIIRFIAPTRAHQSLHCSRLLVVCLYPGYYFNVTAAKLRTEKLKVTAIPAMTNTPPK